MNNNFKNINEYQIAAARTLPVLSDNKDIIHMLFGITTEVGELTDTFKRELAYNKPIDIVNVKEEIGDLLWYVAGLCTFYEIDLSEICTMNINKLKARYPDKFESELALNRDLDKERNALTS